MSLSVALNTARSSLATTAKQIAISGGNIAGADDPSRTRKIAQPTTDADGAVRVVSVTRADRPAAVLPAARLALGDRGGRAPCSTG